ncbi:hypothetical protein KIN20_009646, partial [Parelaphostrongylus tenuis]
RPQYLQLLRANNGYFLNTARRVNDVLMISLLATIAKVFGCGVLPLGQDNEHYLGELVEIDVAKCSESSDANAGVGPFRSQFFSATATVDGN